jgi:hypothetical protein
LPKQASLVRTTLPTRSFCKKVFGTRAFRLQMFGTGL